MKTNRRGFLGRAIVAAAAVFGAGAVKGSGVAESAPEFNEPLGLSTTHQQLAESFKARQTTSLVATATASPAKITFYNPNGTMFANDTITGTSGYGLYLKPWPEPFTGKLEAGAYLAPADRVSSGVSIQGAGMDQTIIVHPGIIADARAEGYADGYMQATQRAESKVAMGLPLRV